MNYCQRIVLALALLSLASVQTGCIEMPSMIQISLNDWPRNLPDVARLARCSEIKVAIANPPGSVLYGEPNAGVVSGYVIHDTEIDREAMGRIDNQVGQIFADHLQRAFPDKRVSYNLTNLESSVRRPDQPAQVQDSSAICLLTTPTQNN